MAKIKGNLIMMNIRGMIGEQLVVKERKGVPYVCAPPTRDENRKPTKNQAADQNSFGKAVAYAQSAIKNPDIKRDYKAVATGGQSAFNVAIKDARYPPQVTAITSRGYSGNSGDIIFIQATDNFRVTAVTVAIFSSEGEIIEEGNAAYDGSIWLYHVSRKNEKIEGSRIIAKAFDLPGNEGSLEVNM
jgi:hypothetical protein